MVTKEANPIIMFITETFEIVLIKDFDLLEKKYLINNSRPNIMKF